MWARQSGRSRRPGTRGPRAAADLLPLVYAELRQLALARLAREAPGQTLDATGLVHEAYLRLVGAPAGFDGRGHFFAAAAEALRRILSDQEKKRGRGSSVENLGTVARPAASDGGEQGPPVLLRVTAARLTARPRR